MLLDRAWRLSTRTKTAAWITANEKLEPCHNSRICMVREPSKEDPGTLTTGSPAATGIWDGASAATRTGRVPLIPYWPAHRVF